MKISHVINDLSYGGAEDLVVNLAQQQMRLGHQVSIVCLQSSNGGPLKRAQSLGIPVVDLCLRSRFDLVTALLKMRNHIKGNDVVHSHLFPSQLYVCMLSQDIVLVTTEHNTDNRRRGYAVLRFLERWMYAKYCLVVCISQAVQDALEKWLDLDLKNTIVLNNGIDLSRFFGAGVADMSVVLGESHQSGNKYVINIARMVDQKDQDTVIRAMSHLSDNVHLLLVGDGPRQAELAKLAAIMGLEHRIHFLGFRSDVAELIKASEIVVISSHFEGFGLAAVEGMACGTPVIATDLPGLAQVVNGAGVLFPPSDYVRLALEIHRLLDEDEEYSSLRKSGLKRAHDFDIQEVAKRYVAAYYEILTGGMKERA